ncbi:Coatomer, beta' subunit [Atractiella rhizophila]|nr:Coatomer, beta' subunit [Atractiella rhizophila]
MPLLLDVKRKFRARSARVKSLDFHPTEPWLLAGLYTGHVYIWHSETGDLIKSFEATEVPVRCVKFIPRKNWFICGADDFQLRVFNYNTSEKITAFEAHPDYIRALAVHPTRPLVITASDDLTIKVWDWDKGWKCTQVCEGHTHYIMNIALNPKDPNTFATSCLDRTVKVWTIGSPHANFSFEACDRGVNYVEYYQAGDKPWMVTTGDDRLVKIWDYLSKSLIATLSSHTSNVSFALFHPTLPILVSGAEDGTIKIWHSSTYRLENTLNYGLQRAWCVAWDREKKSNVLAVGFDEGAVVLKLGREEPSVSMDVSGKVVYARNTEILSTHLGTIEGEVKDGEKLQVSLRELGTTEVYPQSLQHSPNGRFVTVCGDGEYIIYTALAWRNKSFGSGLHFAWSHDSNTYAVREASSKVKVFKNFKERPGLVRISYNTDGLWGGHLLAVKGPGFIVFYDWETGALVRRIEVEAKEVSWSPTGSMVAIISEDSFYILRFDRDAYQQEVDASGGIDNVGDEGVEAAFDLTSEISEGVRTGKWIGDCFVYTTSSNKLNYLLGGQTQTLNISDTEMYLLGYLPAQNRIYLCDKEMNIFSFALSVAVLDYQTAVLRGDMEEAESLLPSIPTDQRNRIARFLESHDFKELALQVSTDVDHRFDLAISLDDLDTALQIVQSTEGTGYEAKWRTIGDRALATWRIDLAAQCFTKAGDLSALLLIYTSTGDHKGLAELAAMSLEKGQNNIAFASKLQTGATKDCVDILLNTDRISEAALFSRTYAPSQTSRTVKAWKSDLVSKKKNKIASMIADPEERPDAFEEGWEAVLAKELDLQGIKLNGMVNGSHEDENEPLEGDEVMVDKPSS